MLQTVPTDISRMSIMELTNRLGSVAGHCASIQARLAKCLDEVEGEIRRMGSPEAPNQTMFCDPNNPITQTIR